MKLIGKIVCFFKGHMMDSYVYVTGGGSWWVCSRCGCYQAIDQNHGTPGDQA